MSERLRWSLLGIAAIMGGLGIALAAASSHLVDYPALSTAAQLLVMHAVAANALIALATRCRVPGVWGLAAVLLLAGSALFAGDIAMRAFAGQHLFPMAAPTGGFVMIAGWALGALGAILELRAASN